MGSSFVRLRGMVGVTSVLALAAGMTTPVVARAAGASRGGIHSVSPQTLQLAQPTRLLFHEYYNGRGYFEQAPLTGDGQAQRLFRHDGEPLAAVGSKTRLVWINEPDDWNKKRILVATDSGRHAHVLVHHVPNASDLVLAGPYVYWGGLHWVGRVRLNGSELDRRFIRIPREAAGTTEDGMTTDGKYLYFTQCFTGRIGKVPIATASDGGAVRWLVPGPHNRNFCPQSIALSGHQLFYENYGDIGRIDVDGSGRNDHWRHLKDRDAPTTVVADRRYLYWDTCNGTECSSSHIARMTSSGQHLRTGLYDHIDQGLTLAP